MSEKSNRAQWEIREGPEGKSICLSGQWNLNAYMHQRQHILQELGAVAEQTGTWDLEQVEMIDSAGALLLWRLWGEKVPRDLHCDEAQQKWIDRLAELPSPSPPPPWHFTDLVDALGARVADVLRGIGGFLVLIGQLMLDFAYTVAHPRLIPWKEISASIYNTGVTPLLLLGGIGFLIGVVMTFQLAMTIRQFGANTMIINLLGLAMLRELGPVIAGIILTGRTGSAITASIGTMHVTEEYDALRTFGASPTQRLVLPKVIGMAVTVPLLVVWTDVTGMLGGIITSQAQLGVGYRLFLQRLPTAVPWVNFWIGLGKGVIFGLIIATVSSYFGLRCQPSTESLSRETTSAVVAGLSLILTLDAISGALLTNVGLL